MKNKLVINEHQIQLAIMEWLQYKGWMVWRNNSGMMFKEYKGKKYAVKIGNPGLPDLFAIKDGQLIGIEVKRPGKEATELQEYMLQKLREHGVSTIVAHSIEDVENWVKLL